MPAGRSLLRLAALLVVVGLAMPGGATAQGGSVLFIPEDTVRACSGSFLSMDRDLLDCASLDEEGVRGCCQDLKFSAPVADDCVCGVLKVITEDRGINLDKLCGATGIQKECQAKAEEARRAQEKKAEEERAAKEREEADG